MKNIVIMERTPIAFVNAILMKFIAEPTFLPLHLI